MPKHRAVNTAKIDETIQNGGLKAKTLKKRRRVGDNFISFVKSIDESVPSEHEVSGVPTSDDSMNHSREDGFQGPLTQVATTSAIPPQMIGSKHWPQFAANQSQVNYNMSLTFMGQMFGQMSKMSDHVMDMNSKLLAQNNALVKKLLQDDKKKQDNDTKNEDDSWLDELWDNYEYHV